MKQLGSDRQRNVLRVTQQASTRSAGAVLGTQKKMLDCVAHWWEVAGEDFPPPPGYSGLGWVKQTLDQVLPVSYAPHFCLFLWAMS